MLNEEAGSRHHRSIEEKRTTLPVVPLLQPTGVQATLAWHSPYPVEPIVRREGIPTRGVLRGEQHRGLP